MPNNEGKVLIHYDANFKELNQLKGKVEKEINDINANPNLDKSFKDEINKIWKAINENAKKLQNATDKITDIELSTKNWDAYQKHTNTCITSITDNIANLNEMLSSIGKGDVGSDLSKQADKTAKSFTKANDVVKEMVNSTKGIGAKVSLVNDKDVSQLDVLLSKLKEARKLRKQINDDPYSVSELDFTQKEDSELIPLLKETQQEYKETIKVATELSKKTKEMDVDSDEYKVASAELQYYRLELQRLLDVYDSLYAEIDSRDNLAVPKNTPQSLDTEEVKKFFETVKANSKNAQASLESLLGTLKQTAEVVKQEDLGGSDGAIKVAVKISTSSETLYKQLVQILNTVQNNINKRGALVAPVKIVVEGTPYSESKKSDLVENVKEQTKKSATEVTANTDKIVNKTLDVVAKRIRASLTSAFEDTWVEILELVKNTVIPVKAEVTPETIQNIQDSLKPEELNGAIDFNKGLDEADEKLKTISEKAKLIVDEINNANNSSLVETLSKISDSLNELKGLGDIIEKLNETTLSIKGTETVTVDITELKEEFDKLNSSILTLREVLEQPFSLDAQWFKIGSLFNELADENGKIDFRKRKADIQELIELYEKYVALGGTNTLSLLTGNATTLEKLQSKTAVNISENARIEDANSQFKQVADTLDMVMNHIKAVQEELSKIRINDEQLESFKRLQDASKKVVDALKGVTDANSEEALGSIDKDNLSELSESLLVINELTNLPTIFKGIKVKPEDVKNIQDLVPALKSLAEDLQNLDKLEMSGFLGQIQDIVKSAEALDKLTTVLSTSKKKVDEFSKDINKPLTLDKSITTPVEKIQKEFQKLQKETSKYKSEYKDILGDLEKALAEFSSIQNQETFSEKDIQRATELKNSIVILRTELKGVQQVASQANITKNLLKMQKYLAENTKLSKEFRQAIEALIQELQDLGRNATKEDLARIGSAFNEIEREAIKAKKAGTSFFDTIKNKLKYKWAETFAMFFSFYDIIRYIREVSQTVIELNSNLIELSKVSDTSIGDLYYQFNDFRKIAIDTGNAISDVIKATADWARMGYSLPDAKKLAEVAQIYKNVGDGISVDEANEYLISTLQGFQMNAEEALHIVDIYNEVANNFAIDTQGIGEALERSAASFYAANTSLEESVALVTTANTVLQNPEVVGTTFKTLSARLRGAKTELEELGEESTVTTSKLQATVKALTGFDILKEDGKTFKSIYEILVGIGKEWDKLTDIERASLGEMLAGKRNSNALYAVLQNIETLEDAYATAQDSAGSAMAEQERYMQGIKYSVEQFKVAFEDISDDILDSEFAKSVVDFGTSLLTTLDKIIEHPLITLLLTGGVGALLGMRKLSADGNGGFKGLYGAIYDVTQAYKKYIATIYQCKDAEALEMALSEKKIAVTNQNTLANEAEAYSEMQQAQAEKANTIATEEGIVAARLEEASDIARAKGNVTEATSELSKTVKNGLKGIISAPKQILTGFVNLAKALPLLGIGAFFVGVGATAIKVYNDIQKSEEQLKQSAKELGEQYSTTKKEINEYKNEIEDLSKIINDSNSTVEDSSNARERLLTIQDNLIEKYGTERDAIDNIISAINGEIEALDRLSEREWRQKKRAFNDENLAGLDLITKAYHNASDNIGVMLDEMENATARIKFNGFKVNDRLFANELRDIFGADLPYGNKALDGTAKLTGSLNEVYEKLILIQKRANDVGASNQIVESIEKAINEAENTLDSYEDFYNEYILQERIYDTDYEQNYQAYTKAYESYRKALISGSDEATEHAIETLAQDYNDLYQNLLNDENLKDTEKESILNFFDNLYPDLRSKISKWKLEANVDIDTTIGKTGKTQQDIIDSVIKEFPTLEELTHYNEKTATEEQKQAYIEMNALLRERKINESDFIDYLDQEGYFLQNILNILREEMKEAGLDNEGLIEEIFGKLSDDEIKQLYDLPVNWKELLGVDDYKNALEEMKKYQVGNVDLFNRPLISGAKMRESGWDVPYDSIATVYTAAATMEQNGKEVLVQYTPILPNGEVLTEESLDDYLKEINGSDDILEADYKGIVMKVDDDFLDASGNVKKEIEDWGQELHELQAKVYLDGELTAEQATRYIHEYLSQLNSIPFEIQYDKNAVETASQGISHLQEVYQKLYEANAEGKTGADLATSFKDLDELIQESSKDANDGIKVSEETWKEFFDIMSDGSHSFEEMESAINKLATEYVTGVIDLKNYDQAQADAIATQLQLAGATKESASAFVEAMTNQANAILLANEAGLDLENTTLLDVAAFIEEGEVSELTGQYIAQYYLTKELANGVKIETVDDCQALYDLASAAKVSAETLKEFYRLQEDLGEWTDKYNKALKDGDEAAKQAALVQLRGVKQTLEQFINKDLKQETIEFTPTITYDPNKLKSKSKSGSGSGSQKDLWKEAYEKELSELDRIHDMELITDIKYYEEREKLNDKYFKDREKYTEEYNKNLSEIYKGFQSAYKQYVDDMSDYWKKSLDAGLISFQQYCKNMKSMLDDLHDAGKITDETYYNSLADYYGTLVENMDKVVNAVQRRLKKEIDGLEKEKDKLKDIYDARKKVVQDQIDSIQKEIDNLEEANKKRQEALDLQKALYNLNRAENQRPNLVYNSEKGYIYMNAEADIKEAQEELEDIRYQQKVSALETSIKSLEEQIDVLDNELDTLTANLDAQIDKLQEYSDRWGEVANKYREAQEDMLASAILGSNWQNDILATNETVLYNFTQNYIGYMQSQADATLQAANSVVAQYHRMIDALNEWKRAQASAAETGYSTNANGAKSTINPTSPTSPTINPVKYKAPAQVAQRNSNPYVNPYTKKQQIKEYAYGTGTKNAKAGWHEIAENGEEIILDKYGNAFLAEGHQLHKFEGGERVFNENETKELLSGKYIPVESILPNYSAMLSKIIDSGFNTSVNNMNNVLSSKSNLKKNTDTNNIVNITVGDVHVTEVDNATQIAKAITNELPNALLQELNKR